MHYRTLDLKIDQFILYVNNGKINLIPPFQRGHVWRPTTRAKLIENIINGKPIPAIFLYREESGESYAYNILDGKQRLESLMLFVGNRRSSLTVQNLSSYFYDKKMRSQENFQVNVNGKKVGLKELDESLFRDFREYVIPTIEITLSGDADAPLDEVIDLFVDINSYGEKVKRFDIVKAMTKDDLLKDAFSLVGFKRRHGRDWLYRPVKGDITGTLKKLQVVANLQSPNAKVDRMWEMIVEIILFIRTKRHRTPVEILKSFIKAKHAKPEGTKITKPENSELRRTFKFLKTAYRNKGISESRLATNQIHFYSMITAIIGDGLLDKYAERDLITKLAKFGALIDGEKKASGKLRKIINEYQEFAAKHTTHPGRRADRQARVAQALELL
jgi:hypothetical protein